MAPIRCCFDQTAVWHSDAARGPSTPSFDYLVGDGKQIGGDFELERFGGLHVDHEVKLGGPVDWQVARFRAFEDSPSIESSPAICVENIVSITDQAAGHRDLTVCRNQWKVMSRRQNGELPGTRSVERIGRNDHHARLFLHELLKYPINLGRCPGIQ